MFEQLPAAPADPILGISEAFRGDPRSTKINLAVGVYKDAAGQTPVLEAVQSAERRLLETQSTKSYLPIDGPPAYGAAVRRLLFADGHPLTDSGRVRTAASPGGTGALRVAADFLHDQVSDASVWLTTPTWANHSKIFAAAGVPTKAYAWLDASGFALDFDAVLANLDRVPAGDVVLLHGCCHNPTGVDPTPEQWKAIAAKLAERGVVPMLDFAYQGFGVGLQEDAAGLLAIAETCDEFLVCSSYSKNFGLYNERVGALTVVAGSDDAAAATMSWVKQAIRRNFSNPPSHGLSVVQTILDDDTLSTQWQRELAAMRDRIHDMRQALKAGLDERGVSLAPDGNGFVTTQSGMFTMSGLSKSQVSRLAEEFGIYVVGDGRINVAGITPSNAGTLCDAIAEVTKA